MRATIDRFDSLLKSLTQNICLIAGWALLLLSVVITVNVLFRKVFNYSLQGVDEYGGYCLAVCASVGFAQAAYDRAHIRIDVVTQLFPEALRAVFDVVALIVLTLTAGYLALHAYEVMKTSFEMGALATSSLRTPLGIPQAIWAGALIWFCVTLTVHSLRALIKLSRGDWRGVTREFGAADIQDEVGQEIELARKRMGAKANLAGGN